MRAWGPANQSSAGDQNLEQTLSSDAARDRFGDAVDALRSQVADIAAVKKKRAALRVEGQAADGTVEVTVDARGQLVGVAIDKSYLDDHDFDDLAGHVLEAVRRAAGEAERRVAEMVTPITERDKSFPTFSDIVEGLPDLADLIPGAPRQGSSGPSSGGAFDVGDDGAQFPTVRR
jgi:DNA-binding protein YbaB